MVDIKRLTLKRLLLIIGTPILLVICVVSTVMLVYNEKKSNLGTTDEYTAMKSSVIGKKENGEYKMSASEVTSEYQDDYQKKYETLKKSDPTKWTKKNVNDAFYCIVILRRIGLTQQIDDIIIMLIQARSSGINVEDNNFGYKWSYVEELSSELKNKAAKLQENRNGVKSE